MPFWLNDVRHRVTFGEHPLPSFEQNPRSITREPSSSMCPKSYTSAVFVSVW